MCDWDGLGCWDESPGRDGFDGCDSEIVRTDRLHIAAGKVRICLVGINRKFGWLCGFVDIFLRVI